MSHYAKISGDTHELQFAENAVVDDGCLVLHPKHEHLLRLGYKLVAKLEQPREDAGEGMVWKFAGWTEDNESQMITPSWEAVAVEEDDEEEEEQEQC